MQKVLEGCNIKLSSVASDVVGVSGLAILKALVQGETDCSALADLTRGRLKVSREELEEALQGCVEPHQRFLLGSLLRTLEHEDTEVGKLDQEVDERLRPFDDLVERMDGIPGVGRRAAQDVLAEIGTDMTRFPSAGHLASWARVCPGNRESGGKRLSSRVGPGNPWLRPALVEVA